MKSLFLFLSCILFSQVAAANENLFTATYKGRHSGINIKLVRSLDHIANNQYSLSSNATSFIGAIEELSLFSRQNGKLVSEHYNYTRKALGMKSKQTLKFDWENNKAKYRRADKPKKNKDYALLPGALDPSLYQLKLQQELYKGKSQFSFDFAKGRRMKKMEFRLLDNRSTYTIAGRELETVEVERINQPDKKQTHIFLIPALNFQIAKIVHTEEDGSSYKVELTDFKADFNKLAEFYNSINI